MKIFIFIFLLKDTVRVHNPLCMPTKPSEPSLTAAFKLNQIQPHNQFVIEKSIEFMNNKSVKHKLKTNKLDQSHRS